MPELKIFSLFVALYKNLKPLIIGRNASRGGVQYLVMLSGAKHLRGDSSLTLRMTVPFMVMLSRNETSERFFGTIVPQNDKDGMRRMTEKASVKKEAFL